MKVMAEEDDPNENVSRPKDEIAPITSHNNHRNEKKRKGMKPRSKRNRKRAKGGGVVQHSSNNNNKNRLDPNANVENEVEVQVVPLFWNQKDRRERVRIVKPYFFTFATFVKGRWEGRTVLDVYSSEFGSYPKVCKDGCYVYFSLTLSIILILQYWFGYNFIALMTYYDKMIFYNAFISTRVIMN